MIREQSFPEKSEKFRHKQTKSSFKLYAFILVLVKMID